MPEGYFEVSRRILQEYKEEAHKRRVEFDEIFAIEFENWKRLLTEEERERLLPAKGIARVAQGDEAFLRREFKKCVWPRFVGKNVKLSAIKASFYQLGDVSLGQLTHCGHGPSAGLAGGEAPLTPKKDGMP